MPRMLLLVVSATLVAGGCASSTPGSPAAPKSSASPQVSIEQKTPLQALQLGSATGLPVEYALTITNPFDHPVTLSSVEIETVGLSGAYAMKRVHHTFDVQVAAHETTTVPLRAWVQALQTTDRGEAGGPVTLRGVARFDSPNGGMATAFTARVQ